MVLVMLVVAVWNVDMMTMRNVNMVAVWHLPGSRE
jgi:hypothetical protein